MAASSAKAKTLTETQEQNRMLVKAALWGAQFAEQVLNTGGDPVVVMGMFSDESISTMIRNGLAVQKAE